jgi:hypothetical protein
VAFQVDTAGTHPAKQAAAAAAAAPGASIMLLKAKMPIWQQNARRHCTLCVQEPCKNRCYCTRTVQQTQLPAQVLTHEREVPGRDGCHHPQRLNQRVGVVARVGRQHLASDLVSPPAATDKRHLHKGALTFRLCAGSAECAKLGMWLWCRTP